MENSHNQTLNKCQKHVQTNVRTVAEALRRIKFVIAMGIYVYLRALKLSYYYILRTTINLKLC